MMTDVSPRMKMRAEDWGGLALDTFCDRVWGLDEPSFLAASNGDRVIPGMDKYAPDPFLLAGTAVIGRPPTPDGFTLRAPISVSWMVTRRCQSACTFCCTESHQNAGECADVERALRAIDVMAKWGVLRVIVGGGEPLMRTDIETILAHAASKGLSPALATNGFLLDDAMAERLAPHVMQFQISLDAVDPKLYAQLRGSAGGPHLALAAMKSAVATGRMVRAVTVLNNRNLDSVDEIAAAVDAAGVHQWFIFLVLPSGRGARTYEKLGIVDTAQARERISEVRRHLRSDLAVCFWGDAPTDGLAVYLDEVGQLSIVDYMNDETQPLLNLSTDATVEDCRAAWNNIRAETKYTTFVNFTSPSRRI